jgi:multicomponent Na+:H+ antiporter subunit G
MDNPTLLIIIKIFTIFFLLVGSTFSLIGMIGITRLPDVYTRLHATGKVSAFGAVLLLAAAILIVEDLTVWKGLILIVFLLLASPVVSHVISSAAYKSGVPLAQASRDDLAKVLPRGTGKDV